MAFVVSKVLTFGLIISNVKGREKSSAKRGL